MNNLLLPSIIVWWLDSRLDTITILPERLIQYINCECMLYNYAFSLIN